MQHNLAEQDTIRGPYTITFLDGSSSTIVEFAGRKQDSLEYAVENMLSEEDEAGQQEILAKDLNAVGTYSEVKEGDLANLDNTDVAEVSINLHVRGQTITITDPKNVLTSIEGAKSNVEIRKTNWAEGGTVSYPFTKA